MTDPTATAMLKEIVTALELPIRSADRVSFEVGDRLASCFPVTALAAASIGAACATLAELMTSDGKAANVVVNNRLAALWFGWSIRPIGWEMPATWDAIAGDYRSRDGWIKLHTNAPHHRKAALSILGERSTREAVAEAVGEWDGEVLEDAIVAAGGCAAKLRSSQEWLNHSQGKAVATEPLMIWSGAKSSKPSDWQPTPGRPLRGVRVLDLTRILAGPVGTRFLAGYGADVLRIDPLVWDEPSVVPEITLGKRCARLDLHDQVDREVFIRLLSDADILVHGYRADALERLGFGEKERRAINPELIDVSLNAYGHNGPWVLRRGFDSLVQFSCGIASEGMKWQSAAKPVSLPVQALDHATGYLIAAAAIRGLIARRDQHGSIRARLSLARTAKLLFDHQGEVNEKPLSAGNDADCAATIEHTDWGPAHRFHPPAKTGDLAMRWDLPARRLGTSVADWAEFVQAQ